MRFLATAVVASTVFFTSCVPSTPEARIAAQPALYQSLPAKHQELVRQGRIDKGMGTDAVYLAWGRPSREYEGSEGGHASLRWDYAGTTPVYTTNFYGGYYGYGRYGRHSAYGIGLGPGVTYVPYRRASVL
ncbi:hypothetical protein, partial [Luteolibacter marinus]|uniref:hypothetical protein n=1 Tax=Luteolibacter marinus TaxID=2776705 RepID=UPI001865D562